MLASARAGNKPVLSRWADPNRREEDGGLRVERRRTDRGTVVSTDT
jgi:hypothetical protein